MGEVKPCLGLETGKNQQYWFPWQCCHGAGGEHHGPHSCRCVGRTCLGDGFQTKQCPHHCMAPGKRLETSEQELALQRKGHGAGVTHPSQPSHLRNLQPRPCCRTGCCSLYWGSLSPSYTPGANGLWGNSKPVDLPGVDWTDAGVCCEILWPQRSIAQHKPINITIKGAYRLELVTLKCLSQSINWVTKYVTANVFYRQHKFPY